MFNAQKKPKSPHADVAISAWEHIPLTLKSPDLQMRFWFFFVQTICHHDEMHVIADANMSSYRFQQVIRATIVRRSKRLSR